VSRERGEAVSIIYHKLIIYLAGLYQWLWNIGHPRMLVSSCLCLQQGFSTIFRPGLTFFIMLCGCSQWKVLLNIDNVDKTCFLIPRKYFSSYRMTQYFIMYAGHTKHISRPWVENPWVRASFHHLIFLFYDTFS
jgi:hypothetical protein